jgi:hypothetical protein
MMVIGERLLLVSFYPETQKVENISRTHNKFNGLRTFASETKCRRCQQLIPAGTPLIWIRGKGSFHKQNPCEASE